GRDALWAHPDMLPTATDMDDPDGFVHREQADFSELDKMLGEAAGKPDLRKQDGGTGDTGDDDRAEGEDKSKDESKGDDGKSACTTTPSWCSRATRTRRSCATPTSTTSPPIRTACGRRAGTATSPRAPW